MSENETCKTCKYQAVGSKEVPCISCSKIDDSPVPICDRTDNWQAKVSACDTCKYEDAHPTTPPCISCYDCQNWKPVGIAFTPADAGYKATEHRNTTPGMSCDECECCNGCPDTCVQCQAETIRPGYTPKQSGRLHIDPQGEYLCRTCNRHNNDKQWKVCQICATQSTDTLWGPAWEPIPTPTLPKGAIRAGELKATDVFLPDKADSYADFINPGNLLVCVSSHPRDGLIHAMHMYNAGRHTLDPDTPVHQVEATFKLKDDTDE